MGAFSLIVVINLLNRSKMATDPKQHHDITHLLTPFFDRQLIIPFLEFLSEKEIYKEEHILKAKTELLMGTKMIDAVLEIYDSMGEKIRMSYTRRRKPLLWSTINGKRPLTMWLLLSARLKRMKKSTLTLKLCIVNFKKTLWMRYTSCTIMANCSTTLGTTSRPSPSWTSMVLWRPLVTSTA